MARFREEAIFSTTGFESWYFPTERKLNSKYKARLLYKQGQNQGDHLDTGDKQSKILITERTVFLGTNIIIAFNQSGPPLHAKEFLRKLERIELSTFISKEHNINMH